MDEFDRLVDASGLLIASTLLGKAMISEHHPQAISVYEQLWVAVVIKGMTERMTKGGLKSGSHAPVSELFSMSSTPEPDRPITMTCLMQRLNGFIGDNTKLIAETSDPIFVTADLVMHRDIGFNG